MKLNIATQELESDGLQATKSFSIKTSGLAMSVLSRLYKNPIDAMVREYLSNMHDAYIALVRQNPKAVIRPPVLHLPTALDSTLIFEDFGIGMSHKTVMSVFTEYFNSTKSGSNDEVGGFGLGSKTAFAYNGGASWSVESRVNGERHAFAAFLGEDQTPHMGHLSTEPTDQPTGITIKIPIRRQDIPAVYEAARRYIPYFPMELEVISDATLPIPKKPAYKLQGPKWGLLDKNGGNGIRLIMGNVPYQLDWAALSGRGEYYAASSFFDANKSITKWRSVLTNNSLDFFIDIGSVNIVPSRDDLEYTDRTKAYIIKMFEQFAVSVEAMISDRIKSAKTEWDAHLECQKFSEISHINTALQEIKWHGKEINLNEGITRSVAGLTKLDPNFSAVFYTVSSSKGVPNEESYERILLRPTLNESRDSYRTFLLIDNMPKGGSMMARSLLYQHLISRDTTTGRVNSWGHRPGVAVLMTTTLTKGQLSEYLGGVPVENIQTTSELKDTVSVPSQLKSPKDTIYKWYGAAWRSRANIPTDISATDPVYYVVLKRNPYDKWTYQGETVARSRDHFSSLLSAGNSLTKKEFPVSRIFGIKSDEIDLYSSRPDWINIETFLKTFALNQISKIAAVVNKKQRKMDLESVGTFYLQLIKKVPELEKRPFFKEIVTLDLELSSTDSYGEMELYKTIGILTELTDEIAKLPRLDASGTIAKIREKYPMLYMVELAIGRATSYSHFKYFKDMNSKDVLDYIELIG